MVRSQLQKAVVIEKLEERDDGRLQATVVFNWVKTADLKEVTDDEDDLRRELETAIRKAVNNVTGRSERIVAHVPRALAEAFEEHCRNQGVSKSRALLARILQYVDGFGEVRGRAYKNKTPIPPASERKEKKIVQILAPARLADGFDYFCKAVGIQKDTFMMREMAWLMNRATQAQKAEGQTRAVDTDVKG